MSRSTIFRKKKPTLRRSWTEADVNAIALPGDIRDKAFCRMLVDEAARDLGDHLAEFGADTPLGRPGQPAEIAPLYVLLASSEASYVTGQAFGATGGEVGP